MVSVALWVRLEAKPGREGDDAVNEAESVSRIER